MLLDHIKPSRKQTPLTRSVIKTHTAFTRDEWSEIRHICMMEIGSHKRDKLR